MPLKIKFLDKSNADRIFIHLAFYFYFGILIFCRNLYHVSLIGIFPLACLIVKYGLESKYEVLLSFFNKRNFIFLLIFQGTLFFTNIFFDYYSARYNIYDTGIFSNAISNFVNGKGYYSSINGFSMFADHFSPNLLLFAPLYYIKQTGLWLILVRFLFYLWSVYLLFRLCKVYELSVAYTYIVIIFWLINFPLSNVMAFEFQPSNLVLPFIILIFLYWKQKKFFSLIFCLIFILGFKEQMGLVWICFGLFLVLIEKKYFLGTGLVVSGFLLAIAIVYFVTPYISGRENMHAGEIGLFSFIDLKIEFLIPILLSVGLLPLLNPKIFLFVIPSVGITLITNQPTKISLNYHYADLPMSIFFIGLVIFLSLTPEKMYLNFKYAKYAFIIFLLCAFRTNRKLASDFVKVSYPTQYSIACVKQCEKLNAVVEAEKNIWAQDALAFYLAEQHNLQIIRTENYGLAINDSRAHYIILAEHINPWPLDSLLPVYITMMDAKCKEGLFKKRVEYLPLLVYESKE